MNTEDSLDENPDTQELLECGRALIGHDDEKETAALVDLGDGPTHRGSLWDEESGETAGDHPLDEPSEENAQTQSISQAITGDVSATREGSVTGSGLLNDSDAGFDGSAGQKRSPSGPLDGPDDLAGYCPAGDGEPRNPPPATTSSYDFNEEASGDQIGIIIEESREFPELDPDNLPDPTGPLSPTIGGMGDTSQEIDEMLGAEVSEAVRRGVKALRRGNRQEAMRSFENALRGDPDDPMAQAYLRLAQELYIRELVPGASLSSVARLRVGRKMLMTLDLTPEDGAVLAHIDGATTLEELEMLLAHMVRETIYSCLARALENGHIEFME